MTHNFMPEHDTIELRGLSDSDLPAIITVDGESATGKTTQTELIAHRLGYTNVTLGMLFCAGAIALERANIDPDNDSAVRAVLREADIDFTLRPGKTPLVSVDGRDVSDYLFDGRLSLTLFLKWFVTMNCDFSSLPVAVTGSSIGAYACSPMLSSKFGSWRAPMTGRFGGVAN